MKIHYLALVIILVAGFAAHGCQTQEAAKLAQQDTCEKYSEFGECVARPGWPDPPEEMLILTMPRGHTMVEPPVPFSHLVHAKSGCEQCHDIRRGQLVERMNFARV
jgi:hypothetical protein